MVRSAVMAVLLFVVMTYVVGGGGRRRGDRLRLRLVGGGYRPALGTRGAPDTGGDVDVCFGGRDEQDRRRRRRLEALFSGRFASRSPRRVSRDAKVVAVHVPHLPVAPVVGAPAFVIGDPPDLAQSVEEAAAKIFDDMLAEVGSEAADVEVERVVTRGGVAHELVKAAEDADLLVLGSRGHGGFMGLLLGSVSHQCVHHATCPVVIVPGGER